MLKTIVNVSDQLRAAKALSDSLSKLGCEHVYIGGFAWVLLGSNRPTKISGVISCHRISCLSVLIRSRCTRSTKGS